MLKRYKVGNQEKENSEVLQRQPLPEAATTPPPAGAARENAGMVKAQQPRGRPTGSGTQSSARGMLARW